jgi:hypothetical protein
MRTITISIMVLRFGVLLALILGILFWLGVVQNDTVTLVHMLIGFVVVISLWVIGLAQGFLKGGSFPLALATFVVGLLLAIVGLFQRQWLPEPNPMHWVIQVIHLLLGLSAIGLGEMVAARTKRRLKSTAVV